MFKSSTSKNLKFITFDKNGVNIDYPVPTTIDQNKNSTSIIDVFTQTTCSKLQERTQFEPFLLSLSLQVCQECSIIINKDYI